MQPPAEANPPYPMLAVDPHPILNVSAFVSEFTHALGEEKTPNWLLDFLRLDKHVPLRSDENVRANVRDLLRYGGFKPTGRSKPASEYLLKAASEGGLSSINIAVDACNAASLHSGLPISVVDLDRVVSPLSIRIADKGTSYVFNASGQTIDVGGLVCLFDAEGPCANAVKDSQRTKTHAGTCRTLSVVWASKQLQEHLAQTVAFYRDLLERVGAKTSDAK